MSEYLKAVQERVVVFDGAMGTNIQFRNPSVDDFWGKEGYNDILVQSRPDIIREIHAAFFDAGCDVVETNTFNSTRIVMAEYDMQDKVHEVNLAAAKLARSVADDYSSKGRRRFVAGSMGPTTKLPSLGHIGFDDMAAAYTEQALGLIEGGVDVLLLETCQDILQAKAGTGRHLRCAEEVRQEHSRPGAGHARSDRYDAAGNRDWRGAHHAGDVRRRRHRHELRHRSEGDERRRPLPRE